MSKPKSGIDYVTGKRIILALREVLYHLDTAAIQLGKAMDEHAFRKPKKARKK